MKKRFMLVLAMCGLVGMAQAQDSGTASSSDASYAPAAGDISGSILFGRGNFLNAVDAPGSTINWGGGQYWTIPGTAPYANTVDGNDNSVNNIVGIEARYFLQDNMALKLSGGAILRNTPDRPNSPAVYSEGDGGQVFVPEYQAVEARNNADINVNLGGEYHFGSKYARLHPYAGLTVPFYYARRSAYDPTIEEIDGEPVITDIAFRHAETIGFGAQAVGGVDYYLLEGFYFGFEVKPVSYVYAYSKQMPAPGLPSLDADTHTFSFFSQTFAKIGFRF